VAAPDQGTVYGAREAHGRLGRSCCPCAAAEAAEAAARLEEARAAWDGAIGAIDQARKQQMAAPGLQEPANEALATLDREWDGLIAHREYPMIGLDNDVSERATA
jgi:transposase